MKKVFILVVIVFIAHSIKAQPFAKDTVHINFGAGIGWPYNFEEIYSKIWSPPAITVSVERGFFSFDSICTVSIGLSGSYKYLENKRLSTIATWNNFLIGAMARVNFYFLNNKKFIPYVGLFGGINAIKFNDSFYSTSNDFPTNYNGVFPLAYVFGGFKYISKPRFGVYAEGSYGFTYLTVGIYKVL